MGPQGEYRQRQTQGITTNWRSLLEQQGLFHEWMRFLFSYFLPPFFWSGFYSFLLFEIDHGFIKLEVEL